MHTPAAGGVVAGGDATNELTGTPGLAVATGLVTGGVDITGVDAGTGDP